MASRNKTPLTLDDHRRLGAELAAAHNMLVKTHVQVGNALPVSAKAVRRAERATRALDELRSELDNELAKATTQQDWDDHQYARIYYPGADRE